MVLALIFLLDVIFPLNDVNFHLTDFPILFVLHYIDLHNYWQNQINYQNPLLKIAKL